MTAGADLGVTARGFARGGSYARLASRIGSGARVLDLGCGDGALLAELRGRGATAAAIGLDRTAADVASAAATGASVVVADAHALPFTDGAFDVVACHLAFMLFDDPPRVTAELARVLAPRGALMAVMGGGPAADAAPESDALAWLASRTRRGDPLVRDRRAATEHGWRALFGASWRLLPWERWEVDLGGTLDEVAATLEATYAPFDRGELRAAFPRDPVPCRAVLFCGEARRA